MHLDKFKLIRGDLMNRILHRLAQNDTGNVSELQNQINPYKVFDEDKKQISQANQIDPKIRKEVMQLLDRIQESSNNLKDIYYALFDNLNALFSAYPSIYQQLQMTVKLPSNRDAMNTVTFNNDLTVALNKFKNPEYLASYLKNSSETLE